MTMGTAASTAMSAMSGTKVRGWRRSMKTTFSNFLRVMSISSENISEMGRAEGRDLQRDRRLPIGALQLHRGEGEEDDEAGEIGEGHQETGEGGGAVMDEVGDVDQREDGDEDDDQAVGDEDEAEGEGDHEGEGEKGRGQEGSFSGMRISRCL